MRVKFNISLINKKLAADLTKPFSRNYKGFERDVKVANFGHLYLRSETESYLLWRMQCMRPVAAVAAAFSK